MEQETLDILHGTARLLQSARDELADLIEALAAVGLSKPQGQAELAMSLISKASGHLRDGTSRSVSESVRASREATTNMMNAILAVSAMKPPSG